MVNPLNPDVRLGVDDEVDQLLEEVEAYGVAQGGAFPAGSAGADLLATMARERPAEATYLYGMGRAAARLHDRIETTEGERDAILAMYDKERARIVEEYDARLAAPRQQLAFLDQVIGEHAKARREATKGSEKSLVIPLVGRWQTTEHTSELRIDDADEVIEWLDGEGREALRETYVTEAPNLDTRAFKAALPKIVAEHEGEIPPGVIKTDTTVTVAGPFKL